MKDKYLEISWTHCCSTDEEPKLHPFMLRQSKHRCAVLNVQQFIFLIFFSTSSWWLSDWSSAVWMRVCVHFGWRRSECDLLRHSLRLVMLMCVFPQHYNNAAWCLLLLSADPLSVDEDSLRSWWRWWTGSPPCRCINILRLSRFKQLQSFLVRDCGPRGQTEHIKAPHIPTWTCLVTNEWKMKEEWCSSIPFWQ